MSTVPVAVLRPLVQAFLESCEGDERAYRRLGQAAGLGSEAWRKRFASWWELDQIDEQTVDGFLVAADLVHLWYEPPLEEYRPVSREPLSSKVRGPGDGRRRIKRHSRAALLTRDQVFAVHRLHLDGGLSMREISRRGWQRWGYANEKSCLQSLLGLMDSYGLERRDRIEATVAASTTHGHGSRAQKAAYKRWHRRSFGFWPSDHRPGEAPRPQCAGRRVGYPRLGERCRLPAQAGSEFCLAHDPARAVERAERLADARAAISG